jgi:putative hydrolase of the HAD superfamily
MYTEKMSIKAVAFDYGGVISLPQDENAMRDMASIAGIGAARMEKIYWDSRHLYDRALVSGSEYFKNILAAEGIFPGNRAIEALIRRDVESWSRTDEGTERLMNDVKQAGLKVGVLSNMIRPFLEIAAGNIPALRIPDVSVYSCEAGAVKPEKKIYDLLLSALGCGAGELVFFDDSEINVEAAKKLGIHAFLWQGAAAARRELEALCAGRL